MKPITWEVWDERVDAGRTAEFRGDFARGQRAPEPHREDGKVFLFIGTFARGMRKFPDDRSVYR